MRRAAKRERMGPIPRGLDAPDAERAATQGRPPRWRTMPNEDCLHARLSDWLESRRADPPSDTADAAPEEGAERSREDGDAR